MVAVIVSNFVFVLSFCSSNAIGQCSNFGIEGELVIIPLLFLILIGLLMWLLRSLKNGRKRRRLFTAQTKRLVLKSQNFKCLICRTNVGTWDYDHKDGNRGNNKQSNCQALCPTCHAKKSRGLIKCETQSNSKNIGIGVAVGLILIMILFSYSA